MQVVHDLGPQHGIAPTCRALGVSRSTYYRGQKPKEEPKPRTVPRALTPEEHKRVLEVLHEARFMDLAPAQVYATLLDESAYLCSERTMYRILAANREVRERREQLRHPQYTAPELLATRPNEVWSWDIWQGKQTMIATAYFAINAADMTGAGYGPMRDAIVRHVRALIDTLR